MRSLGCRSRSSQVDGIGLNFSPFLPVQRHSIHLKKKKGLIRYVFLLTGKLIHVDLASSLGLEIPVRVGTVHAQSPSKQQKYRYPIGRTDPRLFRGPPRFFHKKRRHRTSIKSKISRYHGGGSLFSGTRSSGTRVPQERESVKKKAASHVVNMVVTAHAPNDDAKSRGVRTPAGPRLIVG